MLWNTSKVTIELREILDPENPLSIFKDVENEFLTRHIVTIKSRKPKDETEEASEETEEDVIYHEVPYFDGESLKKAILDHFYFRQIGFETVGRFLHHFNARIREVMPYIDQLYYSEWLMYSQDDPLQSYNLTEDFARITKTDSTQTGDGSVTDDRTQKHSNTPQGTIANLDTHISDATRDTGSNTSTSKLENKGQNDEIYSLHRYGNIGVQPLGQEIEAYRKACIMIVEILFEKLDCLFLGVY